MTKKNRGSKFAASLASDPASIREDTETERTAQKASYTSEPILLIGPLAHIELISGPKLRAKLGISPVTLWRWRHDEEGGFPAAKVINGRLYFPVGAVSDWLAKQPVVA
jgi:predicted DNA-binding transcriptional regulator AlpA